MDYRELVQKLGDRTNQNTQTSELILEHRTGNPIHLSIYAGMTTGDWQTPDKPALRCKVKTTPGNSGRKDGLPKGTSPASCAADCPKIRNTHSAKTGCRNESSPLPHPQDNLIFAETHQ